MYKECIVHSTGNLASFLIQKERLLCHHKLLKYVCTCVGSVLPYMWKIGPLRQVNEGEVAGRKQAKLLVNTQC